MSAAAGLPPSNLRQTYARDGYVIVPDLIEPGQIDAIRTEIAAFFARAATQPPAPTDDLTAPAFHEFLFGLFQTNFPAYHGAAKLANHAVSLHRLGTDPDILSCLKTLGVGHPVICARPLIWFHSPRLAKTERYHRLPAHQEWSNMQGSVDGAVVWFPLLPVAPEMGRLQVVPGSHRDGLLPLSRDADSDYPLSIDPARIDETDFAEVDVPVGSALIFSPFLVHRSGENRSEHARITANFRFNNAADPGFAARDFPNPFQYAAPTTLDPETAPTPGDIERALKDLET